MLTLTRTGAVAYVLCGVLLSRTQYGAPQGLELDGARAAVERGEEELREATLRKDAKATARLLADDWMNASPDGSVTDKKGLLQIIKDFKFLSIKDENVRIRIYGDSAVVTGASERVLSGPGGRPVTRKVRFTRVWVSERTVGWWFRPSQP